MNKVLLKKLLTLMLVLACVIQVSALNLRNHKSDQLLQNGYYVKQGNKMYSENGKYYFLMQSDGNFVVYCSTSNNPLWASNTKGKGSAPY